VQHKFDLTTAQKVDGEDWQFDPAAVKVK